MERDDLIEYSLHAHHDEEKGKQIRQKIYKVTLLLTLVTIVEVFIGVNFDMDIVAAALLYINGQEVIVEVLFL